MLRLEVCTSCADLSREYTRVEVDDSGGNTTPVLVLDSVRRGVRASGDDHRAKDETCGTGRSIMPAVLSGWDMWD